MPGALGTAATDFSPQLDNINGLANSHDVISFDPRGYGKSRPPVRDFPLDFYHRDADDAAELMNVLGHKKYTVMGWSDGAISAVIHAARHPDRVRSLIIFGGNAFFTADDIAAFEATRDVEKSWSSRMKDTHTPVYGSDLQDMWSGACDAWARILHELDGNITISPMSYVNSTRCERSTLSSDPCRVVSRQYSKFTIENIS
eukprot:GSMAST32.ASY1.ANO1.2564.1 assembled CDS